MFSENMIQRCFNSQAAWIVSGNCLKEQLGQQPFAIYPWNEAMSWGRATGDIFSPAFIAARCQALHTDSSTYIEQVIQPLSGVLQEQHLVCWFGEDMFCQINLLVLLAWLEQNHYQGSVQIGRLEERELRILGELETVSLKGWVQRYERIVLAQQLPDDLPFAWMNPGVEDYLTYQNRVRQAIRNHRTDPERLTYLMQEFAALGLGDQQFQWLIDQEEKTF